MNLFELLDKSCKYCNLTNCRCINLANQKKTYGTIEETYIKKKKWLTIIKGNFMKEELVRLKQKLGTGGNYFKDRIELRGKVALRATEILKEKGYTEI